jgi:hypothetical protein
MTIYTVIPFFSDGIEIFQNDIASFQDYNLAYIYATNNIDGRRFEIVENELIN